MFRSQFSFGKLARAALLATAAASALSGCAAIPNLGPLPEPKKEAAYSTAESFAAPMAAWPLDRWWSAYADPQLENLIDEALAGSPDLAAAEARVRASQAFAEQAGAALGPQVAIEGAVAEAKQSYNMGIPPALVPRGWQDTGRVGVDLSWQIDFFGKNRARLAAATSATEAARAEAAAARLALSTAVAGAYADLAQLYQDREATEGALRVRVDSQVLIDSRFKQGLETKAASDRAHAGRATTEAELAALDEAIALTKNGIAALLGAGPDRGRSITPPRPGAIRAFGLPTTLPAELLGRRPDVVAARVRTEAAAQRIKVAKADFYPNVNITGFLGVQSLGLNMLTESGSTLGQVGPAVTLPIFTSGQLQGAYRGARAEYEAAVAVYDQTLTRALKDVADSAVSAKALAARLGKSREALAAAQSAYDLASQRYGRGLGTYLDVLSAEDALIATRHAVARLETRAFNIDVALISALGGGYRA